MKLVGNVILVMNGVPTIYLWKKNEEKRSILIGISELNVVQNINKSPSAGRRKFEKNTYEKTLNTSRWAPDHLELIRRQF